MSASRSQPPRGPAGAPGPERPILRLDLEYDGTDFEGWQRQAGDKRTVQGVLEDTLAGIVGGRVPVVGAGRTDAGVHALRQVAAVRPASGLAPEVLQRALNARLPRDLAVVSCTPAPPGFHPRRWARAKHYRYCLWNAPARSPLRDRTHVFESAPLDLEALARAAGPLVGRHDFACFQAAGSSATTTVRTLHRIEVRGRFGGEVRVELEGNGFLRHMVRNIVGTLLQVGRSRRRADGMPALLASRDRARAGPTAPGRGLCLVRVEVGEGPSGPPSGEGPPEESAGSGHSA